MFGNKEENVWIFLISISWTSKDILHLELKLKIQVAQKKVKIAFENADSSSIIELIPSKIKKNEEDSNNEHDSRSEGSDQEKDSGDDNTQSDSEKGSDFEHETDEKESCFESNHEGMKKRLKMMKKNKRTSLLKPRKNEDDSNNEHDSRSEGSDQEKDSGDDNTQSDSEKGSDFEHETDEKESMNESITTDEGFIQKEGINAEMTNVQQGNENSKITLNQVIDDAHVTIFTVLQNTKVPVTSSSHSSDLASKFLKFSDIPIQMQKLFLQWMFTSIMKVTALEKEVVELKKGDSLNTQVTTLVDEHLDSRLGATRDEFMNYLLASITARMTEQVKSQLPQILPKEVSNFAPSMIKSMVTESLENAVLTKESSQPKSIYEAAALLTEFELKKILIDKMDESQSNLTATDHRECYDGLIKSYDLNKSLLSTYDKVVTALEKEVVELKKGDSLNTQVTTLVDEHLDSRLGATRDEFMNYL
nr:hypothetical protein [Tanacetum cinerariifolium]